MTMKNNEAKCHQIFRALLVDLSYYANLRAKHISVTGCHIVIFSNIIPKRYSCTFRYKYSPVLVCFKTHKTSKLFMDMKGTLSAINKCHPLAVSVM